MRRTLPFALLAGLLLADCTSQPTPTLPPPTLTPRPTSSPALTLYYEENAQVELISSQGTRVLIDVYDPALLSSPATDQDILLTTHTHPDHVNASFDAAFKGQQLFVKTGEIKTAAVTIQGLAAAHNAGDALQPEGGTDYVFVVDMDGLRIAHLGDIGQNTLTAEQLAALGKVDLAITQFSNSYSQMDASNKKGFNLMAQVKPQLILPTHNSLEAVQYARTLWPCLYTDKPSVKIRRENLSAETRLLFMGRLAPSYGKITQATAVGW